MLISPDSTVELDTGESVGVGLMIVGLVAILELVGRVVCAVLFLIWLYRVFANLRVIGARNLEFSPGWAVGWWFVPFLNLGKPFQVVRELYTESHNAADRAANEISDISTETVGFWWGTYLISLFALRISDALAGGADDRPSHYFPVAYIVGNLLAAAAAALAIMIIRNTNRWQEYAVAFGHPRESLEPPPPPTFDQNE